MDELEAGLERAWKSLCRVLFNEELGSYRKYEKWLAELVDPTFSRKSCVSGKEVIYSTEDYLEGGETIGLDEVDFQKKYSPIDTGKINGLAGIAAAVQDRAQYAGTIVLGNSKYVEKSSNINDSHYVLCTALSGKSKYMAYCTQCVLDSHGFGGNAFSECEFCLKCHEGTRHKRCLEVWMSQDCAGCYYSHGLKNCSDCFFCFNVKNKKFAIGNVEFAPEEYRKIKARLLAEIAGEARRAGRLPSLLEIVAKSKRVLPKLKLEEHGGQEKPDKSRIEDAFSKTMEILIGKKLAGEIDFYGGWLAKHTHGLDRCSSCASGKAVFLAHYGNYTDLPRDRLLSLEEARQFGEKVRLERAEAERMSLKNVHESIGKIAFFNTDIQDGQNVNDIECAVNITASHCYRAVCSAYSKYCAYMFWPQSSEHCFGCDIMFYSGFCVNCYHSNTLRRCFEVDSSSNCSDCYFCHNCENLQDCMFCFNVKNKRYAIGNVEVGREEYAKVKKLVLEEIAGKLEKSGKLDLDIFSIGKKR